ncbi:MAG: PHB depolymerase family esterase [Pirellulaceae bacterium]
MLNRIHGSAELSGRHDKLQDSRYATHVHDSDFQHDVCLFGPERYEPRYNYPLIVWLHSCHSSEFELQNVMPAMSLQNYVAVAPRGTVASENGESKFRWGKSPTSAAIAEDLVFEAIEAASSQFSIAHDRIFLAGFGSGASMAWRIALRYPRRFAGMVAMCGQFPHENHSLANFAEARDLPALWLYGAESKTCGIREICETLPVLHAASLAVHIRQYPCGNELLCKMLEDANMWLMEQVTKQPAELDRIQEENFSRN